MCTQINLNCEFYIITCTLRLIHSYYEKKSTYDIDNDVFLFICVQLLVEKEERKKGGILTFKNKNLKIFFPSLFSHLHFKKDHKLLSGLKMNQNRNKQERKKQKKNRNKKITRAKKVY